MVNPKKFSFDSLDHGKVIRYEVGYFANTTDLNPLSMSAFAPSSLQGTPPSMNGPLPKPFFGANLYIRVRSIGVSATGVEINSGWSDVSNVFDFAPEVPTLVMVS